MAASEGTYGQFAFGTTSSVDKRMNYRDEDLTLKEEIIDGNGIRGTRSSAIEVVRDGIYRVDGPVRITPTAVDWDNLLPWILAGTPSGSFPGTKTYPLDELLPTKFVQIDRVAKVFLYSGVGVGRATLRASQNSTLDLELDLVAQTETVNNSGTFPVLSLDTTSGPFIFTDLAMTVGGTTVQGREFSLTIDNMIDRERFFNSQTLTAINALDRNITFSTTVPWGDYNALYATLGAGGLTVVATFTNGSKILTMTMTKVALPKRAPSTPGRSEIMLPLSGRAFKSGSTLELVTTLAM